MRRPREGPHPFSVGSPAPGKTRTGTHEYSEDTTGSHQSSKPFASHWLRLKLNQLGQLSVAYLKPGLEHTASLQHIGSEGCRLDDTHT